MLPRGEPGSWDEAGVGSPVVRANAREHPPAAAAVARASSLQLCAALPLQYPDRFQHVKPPIGGATACLMMVVHDVRAAVQCVLPCNACNACCRRGWGRDGLTPSAHLPHPLQVKCFVGDNEQRWFMWYNGRNAKAHTLDLVAPSSGSIGASPLMPLCRCPATRIGLGLGWMGWGTHGCRSVAWFRQKHFTSGSGWQTPVDFASEEVLSRTHWSGAFPPLLTGPSRSRHAWVGAGPAQHVPTAQRRH